ncbi:hypothetical protein ACJRPK_14365 [Aquimarina sp. 2-A2]|uniref:hypothetical protein n=1 Tax=Aquimarina sp. 2-A2 TaxID=3382644 RepID=UPI00387F121E
MLQLLTIGLHSCEKNEIDEISEFSIGSENSSFNSLFTYAAAYQSSGKYDSMWTVNGRKIANETINKISKDTFISQLDDGLNIVCFMASKDGRFIEECVEVDNTNKRTECPKLFFEVQKDKSNDKIFNFHSMFRNVSKTSYWWTINGVVVDKEMVNHRIGKDDYLKYQFISGTHEVCMVTSSESCEEIIFCTEIYIK